MVLWFISVDGEAVAVEANEADAIASRKMIARDNDEDVIAYTLDPTELFQLGTDWLWRYPNEYRIAMKAFELPTLSEKLEAKLRAGEA